MFALFAQHQSSGFKKVIASCIVTAFVGTNAVPPAYAQSRNISHGLSLPAPGTMVSQSPGFEPALLKGLKLHPENALQFDFIIDRGDDPQTDQALRQQADTLIKYFLASLTVPEDQLWVNLSPYEKNRVISDQLGMTEMGRDMLAQDYLLKQLSASLMYPEDELGAAFWNRVQQRALNEFGTTEIPMNTFNKVWIVPEKAVVYQNGEVAYVLESHLKVMLEEDYVALSKNMETDTVDSPFGVDQAQVVSGVTAEVVREVLIPEIEQEVNQGAAFAPLRQIYHSLILAAWFKQNLKDSLLGQVYVDQSKVAGIDLEDPNVKEEIYDQYINAFKKGVYDYIREDVDPITQDSMPRRYFAGGIDQAMLTTEILEVVDPRRASVSDQAFLAQTATTLAAARLDEVVVTAGLVEVGEGADRIVIGNLRGQGANGINIAGVTPAPTSLDWTASRTDQAALADPPDSLLDRVFTSEKTEFHNRTVDRAEKTYARIVADLEDLTGDPMLLVDPTIVTSSEFQPMSVVTHPDLDGKDQRVELTRDSNTILAQTDNVDETSGTVLGVRTSQDYTSRVVRLSMLTKKKTTNVDLFKEVVLARLNKLSGIDVTDIDATSRINREDNILINEKTVEVRNVEGLGTQIDIYLFFQVERKPEERPLEVGEDADEILDYSLMEPSKFVRRPELSRAINVAINGGAGATGATQLRNYLLHHDPTQVRVVAINGASAEDLRLTLLTDSTHGQLLGPNDSITVGEEINGEFKGLEYVEVRLNGRYHKIYAINDRGPVEGLPWDKLGVDIVFESTGRGTSKQSLSKHLAAGAKRVVLTAPSKADAETPDGVDGKAEYSILMGINEQRIPADARIFDCASCTTNNVAPLLYLLSDKWDVLSADILTVHGVTGSQPVLDSRPRTGKKTGATQNMILTSTGAAKATLPILPHLRGKMAANALRVNTPDGSFTVTKAIIKAEDIDRLDVLAYLRDRAEDPQMKGIFAVDDEMISTAQLIGRSESSVLLSQGLRVQQITDDTFLVVAITGYDNEWGYSNRPPDAAYFIGQQIIDEEKGFEAGDVKLIRDRIEPIMSNLTLTPLPSVGMLTDARNISDGQAPGLSYSGRIPFVDGKADTDKVEALRAGLQERADAINAQLALGLKAFVTIEDQELFNDTSVSLIVVHEGAEDNAMLAWPLSDIERAQSLLVPAAYRDFLFRGDYTPVAYQRMVIQVMEDAVAEQASAMQFVTMGIKMQGKVALMGMSMVATAWGIDTSGVSLVDEETPDDSYVPEVRSELRGDSPQATIWNVFGIAEDQQSWMTQWPAMRELIKSANQTRGLLGDNQGQPYWTVTDELQQYFVDQYGAEVASVLERLFLQRSEELNFGQMEYLAQIVQNLIESGYTINDMAALEQYLVDVILAESGTQWIFSNAYSVMFYASREAAIADWTNALVTQGVISVGSDNAQLVTDEDDIRNLGLDARTSTLLRGHLGMFFISELAGMTEAGFSRLTYVDKAMVEDAKAKLAAKGLSFKSDQALTAEATDKVGGIDLNPALLDLQIKRDDNGVPLPVLQQPIHNMNIQGFLPVIINVQPVTNLPLLLGMSTEIPNQIPTNIGYDDLDPADRKARLQDESSETIS